MNRVLAKYLRTEKFSNRNFKIEIRLYEHGLARGDMEYKKRGMKAKMSKCCEWFISYNYCVGLCAGEYMQFLGCFNGDKVARRWVRRVMKHCVGDILRPNGSMDFDKAWAEEDRRFHTSRKYYILDAKQLQIVKRHIPDFFYPGTYRTEVSEYSPYELRLSSDKHYMNEPTKLLSHPIGYRKFLQGRAGGYRRYFSLQQFKAFLQEFDAEFYSQVCRERTMDDCDMQLEYRFYTGERPVMHISVQDNQYILPVLPDDDY